MNNGRFGRAGGCVNACGMKSPEEKGDFDPTVEGTKDLGHISKSGGPGDKVDSFLHKKKKKNLLYIQ